MTPKNVPASIRAHLFNLSREWQEDFQSLLNRYARERLLYRLSQSPHRERFILKGDHTVLGVGGHAFLEHTRRRSSMR